MRTPPDVPHPNSPAGRDFEWWSLGLPHPNSPAGRSFDYRSSVGLPHPDSPAGRTASEELAPMFQLRRKEFSIVIERQKSKDNLVVGTISVNGQSIGQTYENEQLKIPAGAYRGILRYSSNHHFVQGPGGAMAMSGDFLVEVGGVPKRTDILFHTGNKPRHSAGCILLGPIRRDPETGNYFVGDEDPLRRLRLLFYGTEHPMQCVNKEITITILEASRNAVE